MSLSRQVDLVHTHLSLHHFVAHASWWPSCATFFQTDFIHIDSLGVAFSTVGFLRASLTLAFSFTLAFAHLVSTHPNTFLELVLAEQLDFLFRVRWLLCGAISWGD